MDFATPFLQRHDQLHGFWLGGLWDSVSDELMRARAHPRANPIAWNVWHLARIEDASLNRFIARRPQVLDEGGWAGRLNLPWRSNGFGMTAAEVDDLCRRVDLAALRGYVAAVGARTREIVLQLDPATLDDPLDAGQVRATLFDEGLAHTKPDELLAYYRRWTRSACLLNHGLTHPFYHVGQIELVARLHGLEFD
ncbi:MAG TPA: DinB family protein [Candidatus Krumholzibacteria bacterium]|nr:DinB family protein [Candidatus Krumholzibacteria bacterium]HPD70282.1 DinB family protein [Candidatus Krumholzibacteria bacterium]HRY40018.1 DinB family protein [Candidatus Krumholzibacteria bacterium]